MKKDRKTKAQEYQQQRLDAARVGRDAAYGTAALGLGVDSMTGEPGQGVTAGEVANNALLAALMPAGAMLGGAIGIKDAEKEGKKRHEAIKGRKTETLAGEFNQARDLVNNKARTKDRIKSRGTRGAVIGAAAMLVPVLMSARDTQQLANQSASLM